MALATRRPVRTRPRGLSVAGVELVFSWSATVTALLVGVTVAEGVLPATAPGRPAPLYWIAGALSAGVYLVSLLVHEMAHALVARRFGVRVDRITLWIFGGVARMTSSPPTPRAELAIAVAGPLTSLLAAGVLFVGAAALAGTPLVVASAGLAWLSFANAVLGVFNLLPAFPLDGGRVARALAWRVTGSVERATHGAAVLGRLFGIALILLGVYWLWFGLWVDGLWAIMLGWFLRQAASAEELGVAMASALHGRRVAYVMERDPARVPDWITVEQAQAALVPGRSALLLHRLDGELSGVALASQLSLAPGASAAQTRVSALAVPLESLPRCEAGEPAEQALQRLGEGKAGAAAVYEGERLVGLLTPQSLAAALRGRQGQGAGP